MTRLLQFWNCSLGPSANFGQSELRDFTDKSLACDGAHSDNDFTQSEDIKRLFYNTGFHLTCLLAVRSIFLWVCIWSNLKVWLVCNLQLFCIQCPVSLYNYLQSQQVKILQIEIWKFEGCKHFSYWTSLKTRYKKEAADSLLVALKCDLEMVFFTTLGVTVVIFHLSSFLCSAGKGSTVKWGENENESTSWYIKEKNVYLTICSYCVWHL